MDLGLNALSGEGATRLRRPGAGVSGITEKFIWHDATGVYGDDVTRSDPELGLVVALPGRPAQDVLEARVEPARECSIHR